MGLSIQYLWIKKWRCFDNTELNFSSEYTIHYDYNEKKLDIDKSEQYFTDFYGKNIDLATVVGRNGAGKSSLFDFVLSFCGGTNHKVRGQGSYIIVYKTTNNNIQVEYFDDEEELIRYSSKAELQKRNILVSRVKYTNTDGDGAFSDFFSTNGFGIKYIYYSGVLGSFDRGGSQFAYQRILTPDRQFGESIRSANDIKEVIKRYWDSVFDMQLDFISNSKSFLKDKITIQWPKEVSIMATRSYNTNYTMESIKNNNLEKEKIQAYEIIERAFTPKIIDYSFLVEMGREIVLALMIYKSVYKWVLETLKDRIIYHKDEVIKTLYGLIEYIQKEEGANLENLRLFIVQINNSINSKLISFYQNEISFSTVDNLGRTNLKSFFKLYEAYKRINGLPDFLSFSWGLSSGEMAIINIFSQLYSCLPDSGTKRSRFNKKVFSEDRFSNAIILLDEAEVTLHPEWQRMYIDCLIAFLKEFYRDIHVQVIIATHSPIILSDIPKQNTILLYRDVTQNGFTKTQSNHNETFGANLYMLYNDAFFLNSYMGEYAQKEIKNIISGLTPVNNPDKSGTMSKTVPTKGKTNRTKQQLLHEVELIGDPFLKNEIKHIIKQSEEKRLDWDFSK